MIRSVPSLLAGALAALVLCACSSVETFERDRTTIDPDAYVVALSFDTTALAEDARGGGYWDFYSALLYPTAYTRVAIAGGEPGLSLVMLESPGRVFSFGNLTLVRMKEDETYEIYESRMPGPKVELERGVVTYVGTLVVDEVQRDPESQRPTALSMHTADRWDDEARAWRRTFDYFEDNDPVNNVAGNWGKTASVGLQLHRNTYTDDSYKRSRTRSIVGSGNIARNKPRVSGGARSRKN